MLGFEKVGFDFHRRRLQYLIRLGRMRTEYTNRPMATEVRVIVLSKSDS